MSQYDATNDRAPLGHVGNVPVYAATLLVALHVGAMLIITALMAAKFPPQFLVFQRDAVLQGQVWRVLSYALFDVPSLWFAVEMYCLFVFGREIERYLGRRFLLRLYVLLIVGAPLALLAVPGSAMAGAGAAHLAVFVAFAVLYPDAAIFFMFTARWVAAIIILLNALQALAGHAWDALGALLVSCGLALLLVRQAQGKLSFGLPRWKPTSAAPPDPEPANVDAILDKIARSGIGSLTARERQQLEAARERLLRK